MSRTSKLAILAVAVLVVVVAAAVVVVLRRGGADTGDHGELELTFEGDEPYENHGSADLDVSLLTDAGGTAQVVSGNDGGRALRLPEFQATNEPRAAIVVRDNGNDDLSPGQGDFKFGADFTIDQTSSGSPTDNGNNLIQRGLFDAPMQLKLEVDKVTPNCRVKGSQGVVDVRSPHDVEPDQWYRATCERRGQTVTLTVTRLSDGQRWTATGKGPTGSLQSPDIPLTVGGKTDVRGQFVGPSDQFNGTVDNAFFRREG